jgi:hypothetical protein
LISRRFIMKRASRIILICLMIAAVLPVYGADLETFQAGFQEFATGVAGTLGSSATTGLNWSTAYVGQFPHFGVGVTVGAGLIPFSNVKPVLDMLAITLPSEFSFIGDYGIPMPALVVDARIGGFFLPFDIGLKVGLIPEQYKNLLQDISLDYLMFGGDLRYAILDGKGLMPALSIGVGYSYYKGTIGLTGLMSGSDVDITGIMNAAHYSGTHTLSMSSPELFFDWESSVFEGRVQLSKTFLFITPSVGVSAAYAVSTAGGGLTSTVTYTGSATWDDVVAVAAAAGQTVPTKTGITVSSEASGMAYRAFGGVDIALLFMHLDASVSYNLLTGSLGGAVNLRVQL